MTNKPPPRPNQETVETNLLPCDYYIILKSIEITSIQQNYLCFLFISKINIRFSIMFLPFDMNLISRKYSNVVQGIEN